MSGEFTDLFAVVAVAEAVTIPLLRRAAIIDAPGSHRSSHAVPTLARQYRKLLDSFGGRR